MEVELPIIKQNDSIFQQVLNLKQRHHLSTSSISTDFFVFLREQILVCGDERFYCMHSNKRREGLKDAGPVGFVFD